MIKLSKILSEVLVKNKKTGNMYNVVKMNPQTQEKPTPKDIKKANVAGDKTANANDSHYADCPRSICHGAHSVPNYHIGNTPHW